MESGGYDAEFVNFVPDHYKCSICLLVMRDPVQLRCGHQFCGVCFDIAVKMRDLPCPLDNTKVELNWVFPDNAVQRLILDLKVKCKYYQNGCTWNGELRDLECHYKVCEKFPLECTNKCGLNNIAREKLPTHIKEDCLLTKIECSYHCVGCSFKEKRCEVEKHEKDIVDQHLAMSLSRIASQQNEVTTQLNKVITLENEVKTQKQEIETLKQKSETQKHEIEQLKTTIKKLTTQNIFEYSWKIENFNRKYKSKKETYSDAFYTSMGYRLRLMFTRRGEWYDDDDDDDGIGIYVQIMKGEHDHKLSWPFLNIYKVSLINQHDRNDNQSEIMDPKKWDDDSQQS